MNGFKSFRHKLYKRAPLVLSSKLIFRIKFRDGVCQIKQSMKNGRRNEERFNFLSVSKKNGVIKKKKKKLIFQEK